MKRVDFHVLLILIGGMICLSCSPGEDQKSMELLKKSIAAHGGLSEWEELEAIHFSKKTVLFDEEGLVEEELDQRIEFQLKPNYAGKIAWSKDSIVHVLEFDGEKINYQMAGNQLQNTDFLSLKKQELDAALYVVGMPWKLMEDQSAKLIYKGVRETALGQVEVIEVDYGPGSDRWWYYFDTETHLMVGNEVQLKDHRSLIENLDFKTVNGMTFYGARKSYRIDSLGQKLYLRAAYQYGDYKLIP